MKRPGLLTRKFNEQAGKCALCGKEMELSLDKEFDSAATLDHIIPVSVLKAAGLKKSFMNEYNTQVVHRKCNQIKSNKPQSQAVGLVNER